MPRSTNFCFLNYCGKMYAIVPEEHAGTDQLTGEYRPATLYVREIKGNVEFSNNDTVKIDLSQGETKTADKTLYTYTKLKINTYICILPPDGFEGDPELYQITSERSSTYFMYRIIGELRYSYDMNMVTSMPIDIVEFQKFLESGKTSLGNFSMFDKQGFA